MLVDLSLIIFYQVADKLSVVCVSVIFGVVVLVSIRVLEKLVTGSK